MENKSIDLDRNVADVEVGIDKTQCFYCDQLPRPDGIASCTECEQIFCFDCNEGGKCPKCQSIFTNKVIPAGLSNVFALLLMKCIICNKRIKYYELLEHEARCELLNKVSCGECSYSDTKANYSHTELLINHIEHRLFNKLKEYLNINIDNRLNSLNVSELIKSEIKIASNISLEYKYDICSNADNAYALNNRLCVIDSFIIYPDDKYNICIYDINKALLIKTITNAHNSTILTLSACEYKDSHYFISTSFDRSVKLWLIESNYKNILEIKDAHSDYSIFSSDLFIDDGNLYILTMNSNEKCIKIWNSLGEIKTEIKIDYKINFCFTACLDKMRKVLVCGDKGIATFSVLSGEKDKLFEDLGIITACVSGELIISSDSSGIIKVWNYKEDRIISQIDYNGKILCINYLIENLVCAGTSDGKILIVDIYNRNIIENNCHKDYLFSLTKIENKSKLLLCSYGFDKSIKIHELIN